MVCDGREVLRCAQNDIGELRITVLGNSLTVWGMSRRSPIGVGDDGFVGGPAHLGAGLRWKDGGGGISQSEEGTFETGF